MHFHLKNLFNDELIVDAVVWSNLLLLGKLYGFEEPIVTVDMQDHETVCDGKPYDGINNRISGLFVMSEYADAWADALEKALVDLPDNFILSKPNIKMDDVNLRDLNSHPNLREAISASIDAGNGDKTIINPHLTPFELFGGRSKKIVLRFIEFCREGGFIG